ncbi:MAG: hypothetical protein WAZ77_19565 [Candidatus Nitrosopolaris sp.]|jgi:hypothetical protein
MHKFSLALGAIIAITVMMAIPMMAIPTTNFHIVTAYSCSSSSTAHTRIKIRPIPQCKPIWVNGKLISTTNHETDGNVSTHKVNCA